MKRLNIIKISYSTRRKIYAIFELIVVALLTLFCAGFYVWILIVLWQIWQTGIIP
jgi:hypothetical protein